MSLVEWIESVLGTYTPVTYEVYRATDELGAEIYDTVVAPGFAGIDWRYVITGLFLVVTVWSVFRLLGVLFGGISK